jgi:hypothetical protein
MQSGSDDVIPGLNFVGKEFGTLVASQQTELTADWDRAR